MRSADVSDLRPEARRRDRVVNETQPAAGRQMRRYDRKPVGIMQRQMGDADASFIDGQRLGDLTRVGGNGVTRQPHIFPAAGCSRCRQKQLQDWVDGRKRGLGVPYDPFDDAPAALRQAHRRLAACHVGQFLGRAARAQDEFRLIRLDKTRHQVFRQRRINQRGRVARRRRRKKTDDRFGIDAAEQKNQALVFRGDRLGEIKACSPKLLARQPVVVAIVIDRRRRFKARDERKKSAAGEV